MDARRSMPFDWGTHDCMTFAADGVKTLIDIDVIEDRRGSWSTESEGSAIVEAEGGFEAMMAARMTASALPEIDPKFAQRGDICLVRYSNQETAGLVVGTTVAVPGVERVQFVSRRHIHRAWAV